MAATQNYPLYKWSSKPCGWTIFSTRWGVACCGKLPIYYPWKFFSLLQVPGVDDLGIHWKSSLRITGWSHLLQPPSYLMNDYVDTWCWGCSFVKELYHMVRVILKLMQLPRIPISNLKPGPCSNFQPVHYLFISNLKMQCKDSCHYWSWIVNIELDYRDLVSIFTFQGLTSDFRCTVQCILQRHTSDVD